MLVGERFPAATAGGAVDAIDQVVGDAAENIAQVRLRGVDLQLSLAVATMRRITLAAARSPPRSERSQRRDNSPADCNAADRWFGWIIEALLSQ